MNETMGELDVAFINTTERIAVLTDDRAVPITHFFDDSGDECGPMVAVYCVAGQEGIGWFAIDLTCFSYAMVH